MLEPEHPEIAHLEGEVEVYHPVRGLFLLDLLQNRDSRPVLIDAGSVLLLGVVVYHWLARVRHLTRRWPSLPRLTQLRTSETSTP